MFIILYDKVVRAKLKHKLRQQQNHEKWGIYYPKM